MCPLVSMCCLNKAQSFVRMCFDSRDHPLSTNSDPSNMIMFQHRSPFVPTTTLLFSHSCHFYFHPRSVARVTVSLSPHRFEPCILLQPLKAPHQESNPGPPPVRPNTNPLHYRLPLRGFCRHNFLHEILSLSLSFASPRPHCLKGFCYSACVSTFIILESITCAH